MTYNIQVLSDPDVAALGPIEDETFHDAVLSAIHRSPDPQKARAVYCRFIRDNGIPHILEWPQCARAYLLINMSVYNSRLRENARKRT